MFQALGDLGDFIGGVAVLVTLIFLIRQLRDNTSSVKTATYQAAVDTMSTLSSALARDAELFEIMVRGNEDRGSLPDLDRGRFDLIMLSTVRAYENLHFQYRHGSISDEEWVGWDGRIRSATATAGFRDWWQLQRLAFNPAFREFIESDASGEVPGSLLDLGAKPDSPVRT